MTSALYRPGPARGFGITHQRAIAGFCAAALVTIAALAHATMKQWPVLARTPPDLSAQCEHDAGIAVEGLAAIGIDVRSPKLRRDRERTIQACRNGFPDFRWLTP